ncbi:hypothetical protein YC2023_080435 [Brassica napus]
MGSIFNNLSVGSPIGSYIFCRKGNKWYWLSLLQTFLCYYGACQAVTCVVFFGFLMAICTTFKSNTSFMDFILELAKRCIAISLSHSFIVQTNHKPITIRERRLLT